MTGLLLVLPLVVPLGAGALALLWRERPLLGRAAGLAGALGLLASGVALLERVSTRGIQVVQVGSWPFPFGISLVADLFSALMVVLAGGLGTLITVYALGATSQARRRHGFDALVQALLMGVCGAFLTGDLFNLYVWFEVLLIASFVLLALGGTRAQLEGAVKYVTLNLFASALFLAGVGLIYGMAGSLSLADLAIRLRAAPHSGLVNVVSVLLLVAFGIKAAVFPLFYWLPASYHTPPPEVSALFVGLLTKVGVYALARVFPLLFAPAAPFLSPLLLGVATLTMLTGVLGAAAQYDVRRILAFHSISQIGYILLGLGLWGEHGLTGALFFIVHHSLVKTALFLVAGLTEQVGGSDSLRRLGGLSAHAPALSLLFALPALSLAGLPPSTGFNAKLMLVQAGLGVPHPWVVATALGVGVLTLFSMSKVWLWAFWRPLPQDVRRPERVRLPATQWAPVAVLVAVVVGLGVVPQPLLGLLARAAGQLASGEAYVQAARAGGP